jgi:hypothetical protein
MQKIILTLLLLKCSTSFSQLPVNNFTPQEKSYLQTLTNAADYLKGKPAKYFAFHQTLTYSVDEAFYDTVISMFFNKEKMLKDFEENTDVFGPTAKMDIIRHTLNSCDYYLDIVPGDSIFIRPERYKIKEFTSKADSLRMTSTLEIFYKVDGKEITVLASTFDNITNKITGFDISVSFEEEGKMLGRFLKRQKNYFDYPIKKQQ